MLCSYTYWVRSISCWTSVLNFIGGGGGGVNNAREELLDAKAEVSHVSNFESG